MPIENISQNTSPELSAPHNETNLEKKAIGLAKNRRVFALDVDRKILSYHSKGEEVNFNDQFPLFKNRKAKQVDHNICCRHLSLAYAIHSKTNPSLKGLLPTLMSPDAIQETGELMEQLSLKHKTKKPSRSLFFEKENMGHALKAILPEIGEKSIYLMGSENHLMALTIRRSPDNISINFYDPNDTQRHKKIQVESEADLLNLNFSDFFSTDQQNRYFPSEQKVVALTSYDRAERLEECQVERLNDLSPNMINQLCRYGVFGQAEASILLQNNELNLHDYEELLASKNRVGLHALSAAMDDNHVESTAAYLDLILKSRVSTESKISLLEARVSHGHPTLFVNLSINNAESVSLFAQSVLKSDLSDEAKYKILSTKNLRGYTGLSHACMQGNKNAVSSYVNAVLDSSLNIDMKRQLLEARNPDGSSALSLANRHGHKDIIFLLAKASMVTSKPA